MRRRTPRIVFRVAAGPRVGFGHVMRVRALAESLRGQSAVSVRGGPMARRAVEAIGLGVVKGRDALAGADVLVVDDPSFEQGRSWIARARRAGVPSVSVHDDPRAHDADLVVSGSIGIERPDTAGEILNGTRFYLLDPRIASERRRIGPAKAGHYVSGHRPTKAGRHVFGHRPAKAGHYTGKCSGRLQPAVNVVSPRVLIALGGGHHVRALARRLVDAIRQTMPNAVILVAAGFARGPRPVLRGARWLSARTGLVNALLNTDIAIVGGGVTLYEACALGVPSVGLAVVPAQQRAIQAFAARGAVVDAGSNPRTVASSAAAGVAMLAASPRLRQALAACGRRLVDGKGADRVAVRIRALVAQGARRVA